MVRYAVSGIAGSISLACWIIVFTPQIYENWRRQSSDGLSMAFVVIWLIGDIFNDLGAILQHVLPTMVVLAVYYTLADFVLLYQCLVYGNRPVESEETPLLAPAGVTAAPRTALQHMFRSTVVKNTTIVVLVVLCGVIGYFMGDNQVQDPSVPQPLSFWGQVLGWVCCAFYLASRVPQLKLNYERKSTDGVAVLFFVFTLLGNITYCASIFAADASPHALILNASWIVGALGSLCLDLAVLFQFYIYR